MSVDENKAAFRRYFEEVWIDEDMSIVDEIFAGKYLSHQSDGSGLERIPEDVKKFVREYRSAFSDVEDTVEDMIGESDRVVTRWRLQATHTGEFRGIPATNKQIAMTGIGIFRFEDGRVVESWDSLDQLGMMQQLGVIPAPEPEREASFDFAAFKEAFEGKDLDRWVPFYADDAEWIEYRRISPPRSPNRMIGKQQIAEFLAWVCSADFGITVADEVVSPDRIAFSVDCAFPDGKHVFEHVIAQVQDGRITRQVDVEAWDE